MCDNGDVNTTTTTIQVHWLQFPGSSLGLLLSDDEEDDTMLVDLMFQ
jgi:hypothetical protein